MLTSLAASGEGGDWPVVSTGKYYKMAGLGLWWNTTGNMSGDPWETDGGSPGQPQHGNFTFYLSQGSRFESGHFSLVRGASKTAPSAHKHNEQQVQTPAGAPCRFSSCLPGPPRVEALLYTNFKRNVSKI